MLWFLCSINGQLRIHRNKQFNQGTACLLCHTPFSSLFCTGSCPVLLKQSLYQHQNDNKTSCMLKQTLKTHKKKNNDHNSGEPFHMASPHIKLTIQNEKYINESQTWQRWNKVWNKWISRWGWRIQFTNLPLLSLVLCIHCFSADVHRVFFNLNKISFIQKDGTCNVYCWYCTIPFHL